MPFRTRTVTDIGAEYGYEFFDENLEGSDEGLAIAEAMEELGLKAQPERTHIFNVYSPDDKQAIAISVTPFSGESRAMEGALSISEGGHAQGVVIELENNRIHAFTHMALEEGKLRRDRFDAAEVMKKYARQVARETGQIKSAKPLVEMNLQQVVSISSMTFDNLLTDDFAQNVYSREEIRDLRSNAFIVSEISRLVLLRTSGSSCCSCSTSCWGSCSSSSSYVK